MELVSSIGRLAAGLQHEFNSPLAYVSSNLRLLPGYVGAVCSTLDACGMPLAASQREQLESLRADLQAVVDESLQGLAHITEVVGRVSEISVLGSCSFICWVDLSDMLREVVQERALRSGCNTRFELELVPLPKVRCTPGLEAAFRAVIDNAVEAAGEQGEVRIRTCVEGGDSAVVRIHDSGPGIEPDVLPYIFEPFFSTKRCGHACGLGLTLAYGAVLQHGGTIAVAAPGAGGTEVEIRLPVEPGGKPEPA